MRRGSTLASSERWELCELLDRLGPDAPTLCLGWATRDLAAHLVLRERRLDAAVGIVLPTLAGYTASVQARIARQPWPQLVGLVRDGPPWWSPYRLPALGDRFNTLEFFVHHEDVRRAQQSWQPRPYDPHRAAELWALLTRAAWLLYRPSPVGVVLRTPEGARHTARRADRYVTVVGPVDELTLHAFARQQAQVELYGDPADVRALRDSRRGW